VEGNLEMHLNAEAALDYIESRLDQEQIAFWERHIETCIECAENIRQWRQLRMDLKRTHLVSAPKQDVEQAFHVFRPQRAAGATIRSIVAAVVFDSFLQPAFAGARGSSDSRQLVMRAEEFDIHVKIWGEDDHKQMLGQVLPRNGKDFVRFARFHLLRNGERLESTSTDETGEFHFTDVPDGDLSLQVDLPNLTVIGALNVQEAH
jgi:hypothetical protein